MLRFYFNRFVGKAAKSLEGIYFTLSINCCAMFFLKLIHTNQVKRKNIKYFCYYIFNQFL